VVDVVEDAKNHDTIIHVLEKEIPEPEGASVKGAIDWERRVDHMQQHHGQHLLSKAFIDVSFSELRMRCRFLILRWRFLIRRRNVHNTKNTTKSNFHETNSIVDLSTPTS